jgi:hypothetical protein
MPGRKAQHEQALRALIRDGMKLEVHCLRCANFALLDPAALHPVRVKGD